MRTEIKKYTYSSAKTAQEFAAPLIEAGVLPPETVSFTLEVHAEKPVTLHVEHFVIGEDVALLRDALSTGQWKREEN